MSTRMQAEPTGLPFFGYDVIDMERELEVEAGVPITVATSGEGEILCAVLPAGRYVTVTHVGHPDELAGVTAELLSWGCRLEVMRTNPADEPYMNRWETELVFRLADEVPEASG